jgi:cytochrome c oxidase subunit 2
MVVLMQHASGRLTVVLLLGAGILGTTLSGRQTADATQVVEVTAERFSFTPSEIRVKTGTQVEIRLRSDDTAHGFRLVGTDIDVELPKRGRGIATVTFRPPSAGRYSFECSRLCGAGHSFMRGVIIVTD